jgi:predicted RNA binding protein YcfA (HicA-like mRNA interferase family)
MSKRKKLLQRFRQNPRTVRFEELDSLLRKLGFEKRQRRSHATYVIPGKRPITIPFRKPFILPVYVKQVLQLLDELDELDELLG